MNLRDVPGSQNFEIQELTSEEWLKKNCKSCELVFSTHVDLSTGKGKSGTEIWARLNGNDWNVRFTKKYHHSFEVTLSAVGKHGSRAVLPTCASLFPEFSKGKRVLVRGEREMTLSCQHSHMKSFIEFLQNPGKMLFEDGCAP